MWKPEWLIGFRYRPPIGAIRLLLRANGGSDGFIHGEVFEHEYYRLPLASPPATILDLGANTGLTAVYFSRVYPEARLACVEPIPGNLRVLARNLELNAVRATVFPVAVDTQDGRVLMELALNDYGHRVADASNVPQHVIPVDALSISTILARLGWERIGLLKVDIEGHEKALLTTECNWLTRVDSMRIECHDGFDDANLERLAQQFGFLPPQRLRGIWLIQRGMNQRQPFCVDDEHAQAADARAPQR